MKTTDNGKRGNQRRSSAKGNAHDQKHHRHSQNLGRSAKAGHKHGESAHADTHGASVMHPHRTRTVAKQHQSK